MAAMLTSEVDQHRQAGPVPHPLPARWGSGSCRPDINASQAAFTVEADGIRFGLEAIKGVGESALEPILAAREREGGFTSVAHCLRSLPPRSVNHKVMECLVKAGCFDAIRGAPGRAGGKPRAVAGAGGARAGGARARSGIPVRSPSVGGPRAGAQGSRERGRRRASCLGAGGARVSTSPAIRSSGYRDQLGRYADASVAELGRRLEEGAERATVGGLVTALG